MQGWRCSVLAFVVLGLAGCGVGPPGPRDSLWAEQRSGLDPAPLLLRVAVVDGGIDGDHPALRGLVADAWRAPGLAPEVSAHATQLAGIIAGRPTEEYSGGLAPSTTLLDVKALDAAGAGHPADVAAALRWSAAAEADIVLTSLALEVDDPEVRRSVALLVRRGVVVVAASGNAFADTPVFPASYPGVLSVTAADRKGRRLPLAGWQHADVVAPGDRVRAPTPPATYTDVSGTSVAAALAAGLLAACPDRQLWSGEEVPGDWTSGTFSYGGRDLPGLTCPGHDEQGER